MKHILSFLIGFLFFVANCPAQQNNIAKKNLVIISGVCADSTIKTASITLPVTFLWPGIKNEIVEEKQKSIDDSFSFHLDRSKMNVALLQIFYGTWTLFMTPGDSVHFIITHPKPMQPFISFTGKNAAHYNFFPLINRAALANPFSFYKKGSDINAYKLSVDQLYQFKMDFYNQYIKDNQVSEDFKVFAKTEIESEKVYLLYVPLKNKLIKLQDLPPEYLNSTNNFAFTDDRLLESNWFRIALNYKYIYGFTDDPWNNFDLINAMIIKNFKGKTREYLVSSLIGIYAKTQSPQYSASLQRAADKSSAYVSNPDYQQYITTSMHEYSVVNLPFPEKVLASTFLKSYEGERLSLADMLKRYEGKAVYIDFWANWCSACRIDIAESSEAKEFLKSKDVAYLYISIDKEKDENKWIKASEHDGITLDQYLLEKSTDSPFAQLLKINFIPRYIILDANHLVKKTDAARPTINQLNALKGNIAEATQKVVTYK